MAETGKLIEADALVVALNLDRFPNLLRTYEYDTKQTIQAQPDASEPLRKRIAELEEQVAQLSVLAPTKASSKAYWAQVRQDEYFEPVETGLGGDTKGGQDA